MSTIFTKTQIAQLLENGKPENHGKDHQPVARVFLNGTGATLVVTEIRSLKPLMVYGLFDMSNDFCKISHVNLDNISAMMKQNGYEMKLDGKFQAKFPISVYEKFAKRRRVVTLMQSALNRANSEAA